MLNLSNTNFLSTKEIREKANSIFAEKGLESLSEKYSHIPTYTVIEDMEKLGWGVVDVKQIKARKRVGHQKHLVVFRNNSLTISGKDGDTVFPQILLTNSSDGTNSFTFRIGIFRAICENGLVVSTQDFSNLKIRHMGYNFSELKKTITEIVEKLPLTVESMNKFKKKELTEKQIHSFARRAVRIRLGTDENTDINLDFKELLTPVRKEDEGNSLWNIFNLVQEKLISGNFQYQNGAKLRKARKIKNFTLDTKINTELYQLAEEFC